MDDMDDMDMGMDRDMGCECRACVLVAVCEFELQSHALPKSRIGGTSETPFAKKAIIVVREVANMVPAACGSACCMRAVRKASSVA